MTNTTRAITGLAIALASAAALFGCAPKDMAGADGGESEGAASIYYASQQEADAALAAFERENPQCQLWTNWQKMCSRIGADGGTLCVEDKARRARPSIPFCVGATQEGRVALSVGQWDIARRKSLERFCKRPAPDGWEPVGWCAFDARRPFFIAQTEDVARLRVVPTPGAATPTVSYRHAVEAMADRCPSPIDLSGITPTFDVAWNPAAVPVHGVYCAIPRK